MSSYGGAPTLHAPAVAARVGAALLSAGAVLTVVLTLTIPSYAGSGRATVLALAAICALASIVGLLVPHRVPPLACTLLPTAAALLITVAMAVSGGPNDGSELLLLWCVLYAAYFLERRAASAHIVVCVACFVTAGLLTRPAVRVIAPATTLLLTSVVSVALFTALRERITSLLGDLRDEARQDPLTGLLNRRAFDELFAREMQRRARTRRPLTLLSVDLDHFKRLNDTLGHPSGDLALMRVADVLRSSLREGDVVARVGGEEFAVLLVDCNVHDGRRRAEQVREAVAALSPELGYTMTTSVGVASVPRHAETMPDVLAAADVALYQAKQAGRDRVEVAPMPLQRVPRLEDAGPTGRAEVS